MQCDWYLYSRRCVKKIYYLQRDDGIVPILGQVDLRNQAVVSGNVGHKDNRESTKSIGKDAGTEHEEDNLLETSPLTQERCGIIIILHSAKSKLRPPQSLSCRPLFSTATEKNKPVCLQLTCQLTTPCTR